jgi:hypothetical protein
MAHPSDHAQAAATAMHDVALLTRPAITDLTIADIYDITAALTDLSAAVGQTLHQLQRYLPATENGQASSTGLHHASVAAARLNTVLDHAHQALGNTAENPEN